MVNNYVTQVSVSAEPMTSDEFYEGQTPIASQEGYVVRLLSEYPKWFSKGWFEMAHTPIDDVFKNMYDFSGALKLMKHGRKLTRKGWKDYGCWVEISKNDPRAFNFCVGRPDNSILVHPAWMPGIDDLFATDWSVVRGGTTW